MAHRPIRSFKLKGLKQIEFTVSELVLVSQANKAFFYAENFLAVMDLSAYPFETATDSPSVKVFRVRGTKHAQGTNPDLSSKSSLYQVQPLYVDGNFADQLFLLSSNFADFKTALRIDTVSASEPLGSAINIARVNTDGESAYNAAKFAEIAQENAGGNRRHFFASVAYQTYPYEAVFLSLSEATEKAGQWSDERSQAFQIHKESMASSYIEALAVRTQHH